MGLNSSGPGDFLLSKVVRDCLTLSAVMMSLYMFGSSLLFICLKWFRVVILVWCGQESVFRTDV